MASINGVLGLLKARSEALYRELCNGYLHSFKSVPIYTGNERKRNLILGQGKLLTSEGIGAVQFCFNMLDPVPFNCVSDRSACSYEPLRLTAEIETE